jgi:hypothetical protein
LGEFFSDQILTRSLFTFLLFGNVAGLFFAVALLLRPEWLLRISKIVNRWISTRKWTRLLAQSVALDLWFYRYNRFFGLLLMTGSVYLIYFFTAVFDKSAEQISLLEVKTIPPILMDGLLDALVLFFLLCGVFITIVSLFLLFRPSMLRELELRANRQTSVRKGLKPLEMHHDSIDQYVYKHQHLVGILVLIGCIYTLAVLASYWHSIY